MKRERFSEEQIPAILKEWMPGHWVGTYAAGLGSVSRRCTAGSPRQRRRNGFVQPQPQ
jgi:hypothetical protein